MRISRPGSRQMLPTGIVKKKQKKKHRWREKNKTVTWAVWNIQIEEQLVAGNNTSACIMWHARHTIIGPIRNRRGLHIGFITDVALDRVKSISVRSRVCVTAAVERQVCAHVFWMNHPACPDRRIIVFKNRLKLSYGLRFSTFLKRGRWWWPFK